MVSVIIVLVDAAKLILIGTPAGASINGDALRN